MPLQGDDKSPKASDMVMRGFRKDPRALPLVLTNGFDVIKDGFINALVRIIFQTSSKSSPQKIVDNLKILLEDKRFYVSETVASQIILSMNLYVGFETEECQVPLQALLLLQEEPNKLLRFNLAGLAYEVVSTFIGGRFDNWVHSFVDVITSVFPSMPNALSRFNKLLFAFLKAEKKILELEKLSEAEHFPPKIPREGLLGQIHADLGEAEIVSSPYSPRLFGTLLR